MFGDTSEMISKKEFIKEFQSKLALKEEFQKVKLEMNMTPTQGNNTANNFYSNSEK